MFIKWLNAYSSRVWKILNLFDCRTYTIVHLVLPKSSLIQSNHWTIFILTFYHVFTIFRRILCGSSTRSFADLYPWCSIVTSFEVGPCPGSGFRLALTCSWLRAVSHKTAATATAPRRSCARWSAMECSPCPAASSMHQSYCPGLTS